MDRQRIIEDISLIEEQAERAAATQFLNQSELDLDAGKVLAESANSILQVTQAVDSLQRKIIDHRLQKSISAENFLRKVSKVIVLESASYPRSISLSIHGEGLISMELAELAMSTILHTIRASVISAHDLSDQERYERNLFPTASFQLVLKSDPEQIIFSLSDDGAGSPRGTLAKPDHQNEILKLRALLAEAGGWFRRKTLPNSGGVIEFRLPFVEGRFSSVMIQSQGVDVLVPTHLISDILDSVPESADAASCVASVHPENGLQICEPNRAGHFIELSIADQKVYLACEIKETDVRTRRIDGKDFFQPDSFIQHFGSFLEGKHSRILPLVDGKHLLNFVVANREQQNESS